MQHLLSCQTICTPPITRPMLCSAHCKDSPSLSAGWGSLTSQWCLQVSKADCAVWLLTFAGCLFISIDAGLGLGIGLGLVLLFARTAFAKSSVFGAPARLVRIPGR